MALPLSFRGVPASVALLLSLSLSLSLVWVLPPVHRAWANPHPPTAAGAAMAWQLTVEPAPVLRLSQRHGLRMWLAVHNVGTATGNTHRDQLELRVNGRASMVFAMAYGNGLRERGWEALRPGQSLREARDLGEELFPTVGTYALVLRLDGRPVSTLQVVIQPDP